MLLVFSGTVKWFYEVLSSNMDISVPGSQELYQALDAPLKIKFPI